MAIIAALTPQTCEQNTECGVYWSAGHDPSFKRSKSACSREILRARVM